MASPKTLVALLDGADWPLLQPLLDRGWLPTLQRLLAQGASATVMGVAPFSAPMLLASAVTGQRAWRHGVVSVDGGGTTIPRPRTAALWDLATAAGRSSIVVGGHAAPPAGAFSGVFVAEPFFAAKSSDAVRPAALTAELAPLCVTRATLDPKVVRLLCPQLSAAVAAEDPLAGRLADALGHLYSVHNVAASLLETEPWQLGIVHHSFLATIRQCFGGLDRPETSSAVRTRYTEVVAGACRLLDLLLGQLLASVGDGIRVVIASLRGAPALDPQFMADYPLRHPGSGCLIATGPGFRPGVRLGTVNGLDLAPAILHSLGLPCPRDLDGRVLDELFSVAGSASFREATPGTPDVPPEPASPGALASFNLGVDLFEAARFVEALPHFDRAAALRPESPVFAFWLACCLARLGLDEEAETTAQVLRDREPEPRWQIPARLAVIAGLGRRHRRILDLVPLPVAPGTLPSIAIAALADALMDENRWDDASVLLRDHLLHQPTNELWLALARCYLHEHRFQDAIDAARHVLADNPGLAAAHFSLARALQGAGRPEEAGHALREIHRLAPQRAEARGAVAELQPALAAQLPWQIASPPIPDASRLRSAIAACRSARDQIPSSAANDDRTFVIIEPPGRSAGPLVYRPMRSDETARATALLGDPSLLTAEWQVRVWETVAEPRRLVGVAAWQVATDKQATAHLAIALLPRFRTEEAARAMTRPLLAEIARTGVHEVIVSTQEAAAWEAVLRRPGFPIEHWTDESWVGDPLLLRERYRRYDDLVTSWEESGWRLRPLETADWELVRQWGVDGKYLTPEHFDRLPALHDSTLTRLVLNRDGPAGLLVATRRHRIVVPELLVGDPAQPEAWGIATVLLLRWLIEYSSPAASYDEFVLTTNLHRGRGHKLATFPGMRRTREQHHFLVGL
ncbi:MAG TPA: tetratricopeptide repeat protein [Opitutus sp.]|nr:tetratricopeptide repeat protein [Opitutus sp.]